MQKLALEIYNNCMNAEAHNITPSIAPEDVEKIFTSSKELPNYKVSNRFAGLNVLGLVADNSACGYYRVVNPLHYLKMHGANIEYGSHHSMDNFMRYDYIIAPRQHSPEVYEILRFIMWEGKTVIFEIDDDLDAVLPSSPAYYAYHPGSEELKWIHKVMSWCDGVTTTTREMAKWCYRNNRNVAILENLIDFSFRDWNGEVTYQDGQPILKPLPVRRPKEWEGKTVVGWQGGTCFDSETEILTENGWKLFSDLERDEAVATVNPNNNNLEYHIPDEYINVDYKGPMHVVEKRNINYAVTPNHWMYTTKDKQNFEKVQSMNLDYDHYSLRTVNWTGENCKTFVLPEHITKNSKGVEKKYPAVEMSMEDWVKFYGFWLADGWVSDSYRLQDGKSYRRYEIGLVQKKDIQILEELKGIMSKYGFDFHYTKDGKYLRLQNVQLWVYLSQFGKAAEKFIPKEILKLDKPYLKVLFDYYIKGDGTVDNSYRRSYSVSKTLSDAFSEIGLKLGYAVKTSNAGKKSNWIESLNRTVSSNWDSLINYYSTADHCQHPKVNTSDVQTRQYDGTIHCVTVKNHLIVVRRKGLAMVCGQTHQEDLKLLGPQIKRLLEKYPKMHYAMYASPVQAQEFVETYQLPEDRYTLIPARHFVDHPGGLHGIDIALAPLVCNQFNLAKSHLKCLEAMAVGTAIVTSNVGPYSRFNTRHPGYIVNTGNGAGCIGRNIIEGVEYLLQNPDDLRDRQIKGRQLIYDRYSLEKNIGDWPATWRQIADKKNMGELGPPENVKSKKEYVSYGSVGPNDPCPCQSGVKYKSCCKDAWG